MRIVIEVEGGCVTSVRSDEPEATSILIDHDNIACGDSPGEIEVEPLEVGDLDLFRSNQCT